MNSIVSGDVSGLDDDKSNNRQITGDPSIPTGGDESKVVNMYDADAISDGDDALQNKREVDQTIA